MKKRKVVANCTHKPVLTDGPSNFLSVDVGSFIEVLGFKVSKLFCWEKLVSSLFGPGKLPGSPRYLTEENLSSFKKFTPWFRESALGSTLQLLFSCLHTRTYYNYITYSTLLHTKQISLSKKQQHAIKIRYNFMIFQLFPCSESSIFHYVFP